MQSSVSCMHMCHTIITAPSYSLCAWQTVHNIVSTHPNRTVKLSIIAVIKDFNLLYICMNLYTAYSNTMYLYHIKK